MGKIEKVKEFIINDFLFGDREQLSDTISFFDSGIIDSTGILELVSFIEKTFSFKVEDEELVPENFETLSCIEKYLNRKTE